MIGNPVGAADNPGDVVNHLSMRDNYSAFINGLAQAGNGNKPCSTDPTPVVCAYLDLLQGISTTGSAVPQYVIQNPGGFLGANTAATQASRLKTVFDGVIDTLWATTGAPTLTIDTGGTLAGVPQDTFTSSSVTLTYPGSSPPFSIAAMKFTGASTGYVAYVFSPKGFETGCKLGAIPPTVRSRHRVAIRYSGAQGRSERRRPPPTTTSRVPCRWRRRNTGASVISTSSAGWHSSFPPP